LPEYSFRVLPDDFIWDVAYAPDNIQQYTDVMKMVERRFNTDIPKTELEEECNFGISFTLF